MALRLTIIQPFVPHYSAAFFRELAKIEQISDIQVIADLQATGDLHTVRQDDLVDLVHIPYKRRFGLVFRPGRLREIMRRHSDIYVFSADPRDFGALLLAAALRLRGRKVVFWGMFHRIGGPVVVSQLAYAVMARISNACIAYAKVGALNLLSLGARPEGVFIGGTAIEEMKSFEAAESIGHEDIRVFRSEMGLGEKKVILQVVRLSSIKKPLFLLDLANVLRDRGRNDFIIVALGGGELLESFQAKMKSLNLGEVVRVLPPEYDEEVLARWFLSADVFTIPTCIGLSAHHAFSYGVPIVTDNSLVNQASEFEVLSHGLNGLTYEVDDLDAYANAIETILDDRDMRTKMSRNAIDTVRRAYSLSGKVQSFERVFRSLWRVS